MILNFINNFVDRCRIPRKFFSDVVYIMTSNIVNNATIFAANIIIARNYGPEFYGLFSIAVNIALLTLSVSEFGMNYSMIRLYKIYIDDKAKSRSVLLANLYFKLLLLLCLIFFGLAGGRVFADVLMHDVDRWSLATVAFVTGGILGISSFVRAYLQAVERFKAIACQTIVYALLRVALLGSLFLWHRSVSEELLLLAIYVIPLLVILCWGLVQLKSNVQNFRINIKELVFAGLESVRYSKWIALTGISFILIQQSLVYIVSVIGGVKEVALLTAGLVFTAVFSLINDAVCQVLYSKLASLPHERISEYRRRLLRLAPLLVMGTVTIIFILSIAMVLFLGENYSRSMPIFWVTGFGTALTACISYYSMVMHTIQRPQIGAYVNLATLICFVLCGVLLMKYVSLLAVVVAYVVALLVGELVKSLFVNRIVLKMSISGV
ncbi:Membrane protein involved in the export of O-antigen and teichoic acid [Desulfomicrobium norvegicum]|uniref:Membrane protein involved in the export of O-antigen and teichoic acid n=1 Tax=Desulfomicrobium norvegicum (strain DSM 1741 / NCIMB 8310) TaxID=52561 RepID=A0A8G2F835_DESNO|nr:oligosaccharide flippase family protein [Desulfomicrobium norvegicum]SFL76148.1 Membrane protein involved in the export of O-antigen and teichoic acid [Desulfomicrobium norvegicum]